MLITGPRLAKSVGLTSVGESVVVDVVGVDDSVGVSYCFVKGGSGKVKKDSKELSSSRHGERGTPWSKSSNDCVLLVEVEVHSVGFEDQDGWSEEKSGFNSRSSSNWLREG